MDNVNHPAHYTDNTKPCECIEVAQYHSFCVGNAIKYVWRYRLKGRPLEDLQKAEWYLQRAIDNGEKCRLQIDGKPLDAHNLTQVGKCCLYMDNMLDLARQATTYAEGLFWRYIRKSDLDGMLKVVKLMQLEFEDSRNE